MSERTALVSEATQPTDVAPPSCAGRALQCLLPGVPLPTLKACHGLVFHNTFNLTLVYIFEYGVQFMAPYCFADNAEHSPDFFVRHAFVITQFCYQFGVLISRSSLLIARFRRVGLLSILQLINFILWVLQAKLRYIGGKNDDPIETQRRAAFVLFAWMVFVGLLGGASYVNVFYNILNDVDFSEAERDRRVREGLPAVEEPATAGAMVNAGPGSGATTFASEAPPVRDYGWKEIAMNIGALYATLGITVGSLLDVVIANTLLYGVSSDGAGNATVTPAPRG